MCVCVWLRLGGCLDLVWNWQVCLDPVTIQLQYQYTEEMQTMAFIFNPRVPALSSLNDRYFSSENQVFLLMVYIHFKTEGFFSCAPGQGISPGSLPTAGCCCGDGAPTMTMSAALLPFYVIYFCPSLYKGITTSVLSQEKVLCVGMRSRGQVLSPVEMLEIYYFLATNAFFEVLPLGKGEIGCKVRWEKRFGKWIRSIHLSKCRVT